MKRFSCDRCNQTYASSQSLWNHRQRCKFSKSDDSCKELVPSHLDSNPMSPSSNSRSSGKCDKMSTLDKGKVDAYRIHILQFLPCSVEELPKLFIERYKKLKEGAHCTEFKRTLYNQLMGLADELLNRKDITEEEYNDVIDELSSIS